MEGLSAPTPEALDALLSDFIASPEPLQDLAARRGLSLAQALAHLQSDETRRFLESVISLGELRTRVQASMGAPQALTSLCSLLPTASGVECRRTASAILKATAPARPARARAADRATDIDGSAAMSVPLAQPDPNFDLQAFLGSLKEIPPPQPTPIPLAEPSVPSSAATIAFEDPRPLPRTGAASLFAAAGAPQRRMPPGRGAAPPINGRTRERPFGTPGALLHSLAR